MRSYNIFTGDATKIAEGEADFLLAASVTKTCEIEGITQAGIPSKIHLTPTLDAEFIVNEKIFSLGELAETPSGVPTPALITRAVHNLKPFLSIEILNLGLVKEPQHSPTYSFDITPSDSIATGANINAKEIFHKGLRFGRQYELKGDYLILAESTPSGTTTAAASALALGYELDGCFSSTFKDVPNSIRNHTIAQALSHIEPNMSDFAKLSQVSDNMLLFCAGFLIEASHRFPIVLAGGTQMAACMLIADRLQKSIDKKSNSENITVATTAWVAKDQNSNIKKILENLSYTPQAIATDFSFANAKIPILKLYDEGEAKEGVGAGACLAYAFANGYNNEDLLEAIETIMYGM